MASDPQGLIKFEFAEDGCVVQEYQVYEDFARYYSEAIDRRVKPTTQSIRVSNFPDPSAFGVLMQWFYSQTIEGDEFTPNQLYFGWCLANLFELEPLKDEIAEAIDSLGLICDDMEALYQESDYVNMSKIRKIAVAQIAKLDKAEAEAAYGRHYDSLTREIAVDVLQASKEQESSWANTQASLAEKDDRIASLERQLAMNRCLRRGGRRIYRPRDFGTE